MIRTTLSHNIRTGFGLITKPKGAHVSVQSGSKQNPRWTSISMYPLSIMSLMYRKRFG